MPKVGVCLSGCGFLDGAEIFESVATLYNLEKSGAQIVAMAPNVNQAHVINHLTNEVMVGEQRNVLVESARIMRGNITDMASVNASDLDALIFPGGFGAAKNLSSYAFKGVDAEVNPEVLRLARDMVEAGKPIGVICIAPAMMAKILEGIGVHSKLTVGNDAATADHIEAMGSTHEECPVKEYVVDRENKIVSTPAYMLAEKIDDAWTGIAGLVNEVLGLV